MSEEGERIVRKSTVASLVAVACFGFGSAAVVYADTSQAPLSSSELNQQLNQQVQQAIEQGKVTYAKPIAYVKPTQPLPSSWPTPVPNNTPANSAASGGPVSTPITWSFSLAPGSSQNTNTANIGAVDNGYQDVDAGSEGLTAGGTGTYVLSVFEVLSNGTDQLIGSGYYPYGDGTYAYASQDFYSTGGSYFIHATNGGSGNPTINSYGNDTVYN